MQLSKDAKRSRGYVMKCLSKFGIDGGQAYHLFLSALSEIKGNHPLMDKKKIFRYSKSYIIFEKNKKNN